MAGITVIKKIEYNPLPLQPKLSMQKYLIWLLLIALIPEKLLSQDESNKANWGILFHGFIKSDLIGDSRRNLESREGFVLFYPLKPNKDSSGNDINARPNLNQFAMSSRLTGNIYGPDILGAKANGVIEGDFTGASNSENNSFRLRHAYLRLTWAHSGLILGQYWHPLDVPESMPEVLSLNTGAPFHSFSRYPQIRFSQKLGKFDLIAVAASQRDYAGNGPTGVNTDYLRNSFIPNLHAQIHLNTMENSVVGFAGDYRRLTLRLTTDSLIHSPEELNCWSVLSFFKTRFGLVDVKVQAVWGQNLFEHLMIGGVAVSKTDTLTDTRTWTSLDMFSCWSQISTKTKPWQLSVFAGYIRNLGCRQKVTGAFYGRGNDVGSVYRISPMIRWEKQNLAFLSELELTSASFGSTTEHLKVNEEERVSNIRLSLSAIYKF